MNTINTTMINTINNKVFRNANEAYEYIHDRILQDGVELRVQKPCLMLGFILQTHKITR